MNKFNFLGFTACSSKDDIVEDWGKLNYDTIYKKSYTKPASQCGFWIKWEFEKEWEWSLTKTHPGVMKKEEDFK